MENVNQYLTFTIQKEEYALPVNNVREVLGVPRITRIPRMPDFMRGVINLRGTVIPLLDLRVKFALGETAQTALTAVIVIEIQEQDNSVPLRVGVFADAVKKVISIEPEKIEVPPRIGMSIDTSFIQGMGHVEDHFVIILEIGKIFAEQDLELVDSIY
jgi:purine-binding chemotaxis protein CheW